MTVTHSAVIPVKETTERFSSVKIGKILKHDVSLTRITRANTARSWQFRYQRVALSLARGNVQQNCALCTTRLSQRWEYAKVTQPNQDRTTEHRTTNRVSKDRARRHEYKDINKYGVRLNSKKLQRFELLDKHTFVLTHLQSTNMTRFTPKLQSTQRQRIRVAMCSNISKKLSGTRDMTTQSWPSRYRISTCKNTIT